MIRENFIEIYFADLVPDVQIQFLLIVYIFEEGGGINVWTVGKKRFQHFVRFFSNVTTLENSLCIYMYVCTCAIGGIGLLEDIRSVKSITVRVLR